VPFEMGCAKSYNHATSDIATLLQYFAFKNTHGCPHGPHPVIGLFVVSTFSLMRA